MIEVEGYKAFRGTIRVTPYSCENLQYTLTGDCLYSPDFDCWYVKQPGKETVSIPARNCEIMDDKTRPMLQITGGKTMLNKIILMGRLTRDPELRRTQSGTAVTSFSIACERDFKSQSGEKETDFIDIVAWRSTAEFVSKYFSKGRMAVVEGRLQIRDWTDSDGGRRKSAEIVADNIYFGDSNLDSAPGDYGAPPPYGVPAGRGTPAPMETHSDFAEIGEEDGELPL